MFFSLKYTHKLEITGRPPKLRSHCVWVKINEIPFTNNFTASAQPELISLKIPKLQRQRLWNFFFFENFAKWQSNSFIFLYYSRRAVKGGRAPFTPAWKKRRRARGDNQLWLRGEGIIFDQSKKSICNSNAMQICLQKVFPYLLLREWKADPAAPPSRLWALGINARASWKKQSKSFYIKWSILSALVGVLVIWLGVVLSVTAAHRRHYNVLIELMNSININTAALAQCIRLIALWCSVPRKVSPCISSCFVAQTS